MSVSRALRVSREARGKKQSNLGVPYAQNMISSIETGTRKVAKDMAPRLTQALDHPALYLEMAREFTGIGPAWLDGPNVDLHRSSVREKTIEELQEAVEYISSIDTHKPPYAQTEREQKRRQEHLLQVMDGIEWSWMYIGVQCEEYGFSMAQLWQQHHAKMHGKRYLPPDEGR